MRRDFYNLVKMITEAKGSADWQAGYDDCVNKIREIINKQNQQGQGNSGGGQSNADELEKALSDALKDELKNQQQQSGQGGSGGGDSSGGDDSQQSQGRGNGSQGEVTPEDCAGPSGLNNCPDTAGGMISREDGDKIAKSEGFDEGTSDSTAEREWKEGAMKAASKMPGTEFGKMMSEKLNRIYKAAKDWKKELRLIVGQCISADDKDSRYTNKNILYSQNRLARTDKDKFDTLSYMMVVIDTSGSMSDELLRKCMSEAYHVALQKKPMNIYIVQCDTKIQDVQRYTSPQELKRAILNARAKGRGGTDFKAVWELFAKDPRFSRGRCELVMLFTDGYLDQIKRDIRHMGNLLWCIFDNPSFTLQYKDRNTKVIYFDPNMV